MFRSRRTRSRSARRCEKDAHHHGLVIGAAFLLLAGVFKTAWAVHPPTPAPRPSTLVATKWPGRLNTGPPRGVSLRPYLGPCSITTAGTVIDAARITCDLVIRAKDVRITRSALIGRVVSDGEGSVELIDSSVYGGAQDTFPTIGQQNITLVRADVSGGQHSIQCQANCLIVDSWLHDQAQPSKGSHQNAFISNGGQRFTLRHNTLACSVVPHPEGGGCTADVSLFGDFSAIADVVMEGNLFVANDHGFGYCAQLGDNPGKRFPVATGVVMRNNVFLRGQAGHCGLYGPVTAFGSDSQGNVWSGNTWSDGSPLTP